MTESATTQRFLIRGATLADGARTDLLLADGRIAAPGSDASSAGATVIDADG